MIRLIDVFAWDDSFPTDSISDGSQVARVIPHYAVPSAIKDCSVENVNVKDVYTCLLVRQMKILPAVYKSMHVSLTTKAVDNYCKTLFS